MDHSTSLRLEGIGRYRSPLGAEERAAILQLLRDGTYHAAVARVGEEDPELADQ